MGILALAAAVSGIRYKGHTIFHLLLLLLLLLLMIAYDFRVHWSDRILCDLPALCQQATVRKGFQPYQDWR